MNGSDQERDGDGVRFTQSGDGETHLAGRSNRPDDCVGIRPGNRSGVTTNESPVDADEFEDSIGERASTRAEPLPEEQAVGAVPEGRHDEAAAILWESELRVAEAAGAERPGDAAHEHRRSEEIAQ